MAISNEEVCLKEKMAKEQRILDSGCSRHMTRDYSSKFVHLTEKDEGQVTFGENKKGYIKGNGKVRLSNGCSLHSVYLVERL